MRESTLQAESVPTATPHRPPSSPDTAPRFNSWTPAAILFILCVIAALVPKQWLAPLDLIGYAVCHRIPERSFIINNAQLPVCARDTGMFGAALLGLVLMTATLPVRATRYPSRPFIFCFLVFFLMWGFDGFNSYVALLRQTPLIYPPQNWLRLVTGALMGISLSAFVVPLFNQAVWRLGDDSSPIRSWPEFARLMLAPVMLIAAVLWRPDFLYGPIALLSGLSVIVLLTIVNGLLFMLITKRAGRVERLTQLIGPMLLGLVLTLGEIAAIDTLRAALTRSMNLPF